MVLRDQVLAIIWPECISVKCGSLRFIFEPISFFNTARIAMESSYVLWEVHQSLDAVTMEQIERRVIPEELIERRSTLPRMPMRRKRKVVRISNPIQTCAWIYVSDAHDELPLLPHKSFLLNVNRDYHYSHWKYCVNFRSIQPGSPRLKRRIRLLARTNREY